jgi:hypothetical protein
MILSKFLEVFYSATVDEVAPREAIIRWVQAGVSRGVLLSPAPILG